MDCFEAAEKNLESENEDAFADDAKESETERKRMRNPKRKRMQNPNPKTLVLADDSDPDSSTYSEHEAEVERRELHHRYCVQVCKTNGFDVDIYDIPEPGRIIPYDLDLYSDVAIKIGKFAVDDYNQKQPEGGIELAFVKPLKCNILHCEGVTYYLTFEAKDVDAPPDDQSLTYQTQVFDALFTKLPEVIIFRPKLTDDPQPQIQSNSHVQHFISYRSQVMQTEGFDVGYHPRPFYDSSIKPMKLNAENTELAVKLGQCALKSYYRRKKNKQRKDCLINKQEKGPVKMLKFIQPLKINKQKLKPGYIRYYLTFHAKVVGVPDDQPPITYQSEVSVLDSVVRVATFRLKPTENINSSGVSFIELQNRKNLQKMPDKTILR